MTVHTIFGAGPGGLYTAWRLLTGGNLNSADTVRLVEWGNYAFPGYATPEESREPCGRICTHHYQRNPNNSYVEVGGMRYVQYDQSTNEGHKLVTETINLLGLNQHVVDFQTTTDPLYYLRGQHLYQSDLSASNPAPYKTPGNNEKPPEDLISHVSSLITDGYTLENRAKQCAFYKDGTLSSNFSSVVYDGGDKSSNIGYWNLFYDQAGNEGFRYAADANGYSSNLINWNAANAAVYNGEFAPGGSFKTLSIGFSSIFTSMFTACQVAAGTNGIRFDYEPNTRLHSIWIEKHPLSMDGTIKFYTAAKDNPDKPNGSVQTSDYVFLALPPNAIKDVAQATRYRSFADIANPVNDFLNNPDVANYLDSVIEQPSYKIAMFFNTPWWDDTPFSPRLVNVESDGDTVFGPTITDLPLRQIYYFGDNSPNGAEPKVYSLLASYDDMRFTKFWQELELPVNERRQVAISRDLQPLDGPKDATDSMKNMVLLELAKVHYGDPNKKYAIPEPLETVFMNWGLNPFGAGYHAWAAHYDITDVMQNIRRPALYGNGVTSDKVFIQGSAFSNDQAWVEGAYCTAESILTEFLNMTPLTDLAGYPLICGCSMKCSK